MWRPDRCFDVVNERAQYRDHRAERHRAALQAPWRADTTRRAHPEPEIAGARMQEQSLEDVVVTIAMGRV